MKICNVVIGEKFGRLEVVEDAGWRYFKDGSRKKLVKCRCVCGNTSIVQLGNLKSGESTSCGCYQSDVVTKMNFKHNSCKTRLYRTWGNIKQRCTNIKYRQFNLYGGRGITMFPLWIQSAKEFIEYCMTLDGWDNPILSIDRIDTNGNYEPGNIRFATSTVQCINRRVSKFNKTGVVGVYKRSDSGKYKAVINVNKKQITIGCFSTLQEALDARNSYIVKHNLPEYKIQQLTF